MYISDNILVCVTQQKTCERLIKKGAVLKNKYNSDLYVIHVAKEGVKFLGNQKESDALEYLFDVSKKQGADLTVLRSNDVVETIVNFSKDKLIGHLVLGEPPENSKENGIISELKEKLIFCDLCIVPVHELS